MSVEGVSACNDAYVHDREEAAEGVVYDAGGF